LEYFDMLFRKLPSSFYREQGVNCPDFFWLNEEQYKSYDTFRPKSNRDATDLPPVEVANGIKQIMQEQISLPVGDLERITAQLFGFAHMNSAVKMAVNNGIAEAIKRNYIIVNDGKVFKGI
jgi:hypothetical protein